LGQGNENYVKTTTYKQPTLTSIANPEANVATVGVSYLDRLGRPIQQIAYKQSNTGKNIVTHIEYDAFGRQVKEYLHYKASNTSLDYIGTAGTDVLTFYSSADFGVTRNPYSEKQLEFSPLNRVFKQAAPAAARILSCGSYF